MRRATLAVLTLLALAVPATGFAQSVPQEIRDVREITVTFSENAHKCNLTDGKMIAERVRDRLIEIGIPQRQNSDVFVVLGVSGVKFGMLGGNCATNAQLTFQTILRAENIVTDDPEVRAAIDRLGQFPVVLWERGIFGVQPQTQPSAGGPSVTSRDAVLKAIDDMVATFAEARQ